MATRNQLSFNWKRTHYEPGCSEYEAVVRGIKIQRECWGPGAMYTSYSIPGVVDGGIRSVRVLRAVLALCIAQQEAGQPLARTDEMSAIVREDLIKRGVG